MEAVNLLRPLTDVFGIQSTAFVDEAFDCCPINKELSILSSVWSTLSGRAGTYGYEGT